MNKITPILVVSLVGLAHISKAQGTFQNLNFEEANLVYVGPESLGIVTEASAYPGWTVFCGTAQQTTVYQNEATTGTAAADIFGPTPPPPSATGGGPGIIDGQYTAVLQAGISPVNPSGPMVNTTLEQAAMFPSGVQSLEFRAWTLNPFSVSINGNSLPVVTLAVTSDYTLYGVNMAAYAGQIGTLAFTDEVPPVGGVGFMELDDISFSPTSTPEPSPLVLTAIGGLLFALYRRFAAK